GSAFHYLFLPSRCFEFLQNWELNGSIWNKRFPRPFVSHLYFILALASVFLLIRSTCNAFQIRTWLVLGALWSALLQGDLFLAMIMGGLIVLVSAHVIVLARRKRLLMIRGPALCFGSFLAFSTLFIIQRLTEDPDVPTRFGLFSVDRFDSRFYTAVPL